MLENYPLFLFILVLGMNLGFWLGSKERTEMYSKIYEEIYNLLSKNAKDDVERASLELSTEALEADLKRHQFAKYLREVG